MTTDCPPYELEFNERRNILDCRKSLRYIIFHQTENFCGRFGCNQTELFSDCKCVTFNKLIKTGECDGEDLNDYYEKIIDNSKIDEHIKRLTPLSAEEYNTKTLKAKRLLRESLFVRASKYLPPLLQGQKRKLEE